MRHAFGCLALVLAVASPARARTLYVDDDAPSSGDGSLARPFDGIQRAVDMAATGDDIRVAGGMYGAIAVTSMELHLFGGFVADFSTTSAATPSIILGTPAAPVVTLFETGQSILDGFVIRGGQQGVVIDADFMSTTNRPEVRNNLIEQNGTTTLSGGGISATHCDASFIGNIVRQNVGDRGSGIASTCTTVRIENNVIEDNISSGDHGGGLYLTGTTILVRGNMVRRNEVGVIATYGWGAGVTVYGQPVTASFEHNVFTANHAQSAGSGAFIDDGANATFDHDLFYGNACGTEPGSAIHVDGYASDVSSRAELRHVTVAGHVCAGTAGNAIYVQAQSMVTIVDSIFWDNAGDDFLVDATSTITATYTLSEEPMGGVGNLSSDPLFFAPAAGDYHVRSTRGRFDPTTSAFVMDAVDSPSIDVGDPTSDFVLEPGPNGMRANLGHTGNTSEASMGGPGGTPPPDAGASRDAGAASDAGPSRDAGATVDVGLAPAAGSGCACRAHARASSVRVPIALLWAVLAIRRARLSSGV